MFLKMLNRCLSNDKTVFVLDRGDIVKAADTVEVGDEVFVARGCSCALVLRAVAGEKACRAIKEAKCLDVSVREFVAGAYVRDAMRGAYVDGACIDIMNGEVCKLMKDGYEEEVNVLLI